MRLSLTSIMMAATMPLSGQIVTILSTDAVGASRSVINNNFAFLDAKQLSGTGAPVSTCDVTTVGKLYVRTNAGAVNASLYACAKTGGSSYSWEGPFAAVLGIVFNNQANTYSGGGLQDFSSVKVKLPLSVVGSLPSASGNTNAVYIATDGLSASDCAVGGGSARALCVSNGSTWNAIGNGVPATYQFTDLAITPTSSTVQTIGAGCASSTPCGTKFGQWVNSCASTLVSGTGSAIWYMDNAPSIKVAQPASGMSVTMTGSGCSVVTGTTVPAGAIHLWTTTATSGSWDTLTRAMDKRVFLQGPDPQVIPGTGCTSFGVSGSTTTINCPGTGGGGSYLPQFKAVASYNQASVGCWQADGWVVHDAMTTVGSFADDSCGVSMASTGGSAVYFMQWDGTTALSAVIRWVEIAGTAAAVQWNVSAACPTSTSASTFSTPNSTTTSATTLNLFYSTTIAVPMGSCSTAGVISIKVTNTAAGSGGTVYTGTPQLLGMTI